VKPTFVLCIAVFLSTMFVVLGGASAQETEEAPAPRYRVVGSYTSYSIYDQNYLVTDIPANLLTHLNYHPIAVSENGQCVSSDEWADKGFAYPEDKPNERLRGNFKQLALLKEQFPDLKILMSVGGWDYSAYFSDAALTEESRLRFANSCIAFMRENNFDGIDINWRYPVDGGKAENMVRPEDTANFTLLLAVLREELEKRSEQDGYRYLLTATTPAIPSLYENIQLEEIHMSLDWLNLTTYGFHGDWSGIASHHAPLHANERDTRGDDIRNNYNVAGAVSVYLNAGVPADKIVIGIPFYAQTWRNVRPNDYFGLYGIAEGTPEGARPGGILYYSDLALLSDNQNYVQFFDPETETPWMYNAQQRVAISYEDKESIIVKTNYVRELGLGGVMVWELSYDDDEHTLLEAASTGMQ
jgi:chitinase